MTTGAAPESQMNGSERRAFASRLQILPETAAFVEGFCARNGIGREATLRLVLIVEELVTNTVTHGYGRECDSPISISLARASTAVTLHYEDSAPAYDPMPSFALAREPLPGDADLRDIGGLGLRLVAQFAESARYTHEQGANRLWLTVPCGP